MEPPRTLWPGLQLAIDVLDVGTTHDEHVHPRGAAQLDALAYRNGVGLAVRHRCALPVEDHRLESLVRSHGSAVIARGHNPNRLCQRGGAIEANGPGTTRSGGSAAFPVGQVVFAVH